MTKLERLTQKIYEECQKEGEPVSNLEALEMAKMELGEKANRRYEKSDAPRKKSSRERKIDETKKRFINGFRIYLEGSGCKVEPLKNETDLHFTFEDEKYSVKLTKHRAPK